MPALTRHSPRGETSITTASRFAASLLIAVVAWATLTPAHVRAEDDPCPPPSGNPTCSPLITYRRVVGDTATDTKCTDNTVQDAICNVRCPNTTIYITQEHAYAAQHLFIQDKSLSLVGTSLNTCSLGGTAGAAVPDASGAPTAPVITLSGAGHSGDSVVSIHGDSTVTLQYLTITAGASDRDQYGGGIYFGGTGSLTLDTTNVTQNFAGYGGGINVIAEGGDATLTLRRAEILFNTAQYNGGGIRIEGPTHLYMLDAGSTIAFNQTIGPDATDPNGGHGGGIVVFGPAIADIASPVALLSNSASYGGGIAILATSSGDAVARLFSTSSTASVTLSSNTASLEGGAIYVQSAAGGNADTGVLCAQDFRIDANSAPQGPAIYSDYDEHLGITGGSIVSLNSAITRDCLASPLPASQGAVACAPGTACNDISDNTAVDAQGDPTNGSILYLNQPTFFFINRFAMHGNTAGQLISVLNSDSEFSDNPLASCLFADNHTQHELVHEESARMAIQNCTFANNTIDNGYVFFADHGFTLNDSVIYQPGRSTLDYLDDGCTDCEITTNIISTEIATFLSGPELDIVQSNDPLFVDAVNANADKRDYHLVAYVQNGIVTASPAIDFAAPLGNIDQTTNIDLDGNPRDLDVPNAGSAALVRDLGAYEAQPILDRIFADGFGDRVSLVK